MNDKTTPPTAAEVEAIRARVAYRRANAQHFGYEPMLPSLDAQALLAALDAEREARVRAERERDAALRGGVHHLRHLTSSDGHRIGCRFSGCTCGANEAYKAARTEAWRWIRENAPLPDSGLVTPEAQP